MIKVYFKKIKDSKVYLPEICCKWSLTFYITLGWIPKWVVVKGSKCNYSYHKRGDRKIFLTMEAKPEILVYLILDSIKQNGIIGWFVKR